MTTPSVKFDEKKLEFIYRAQDVDDAIVKIQDFLVREPFIAIKSDRAATGADIVRFHRFLRKNFRVETRGHYWVVYQPRKTAVDLVNHWFI
jgi:hypothetical protein